MIPVICVLYLKIVLLIYQCQQVTIFVILIEVTLLLLVILRYFVRFVVDLSSKRTISTRETRLCGIHHLDIISLACLQQAALI